MPLTRPRKSKKDYYKEPLWHYEDPTFCGPYCKHPKYGDYYSALAYHTTQNKQVVTCEKCLKRLKEEGLLE